MSEHNTDKSNDVETKFEPKYKRSKKVEVSERNTDKSDDNETESELRSEKNYKVECENNSMTSIIRESEEERMLRNIMKQREEIPVMFPPVGYNEKGLLVEILDVREIFPGPLHEPFGDPCRHV